MCTAVLAASALARPLLAGDGLRWFLVVAVVLGVLVTALLVRSGRRRSSKAEPPLTRPRLLPHDDD